MSVTGVNNGELEAMISAAGQITGETTSLGESVVQNLTALTSGDMQGSAASATQDLGQHVQRITAQQQDIVNTLSTHANQTGNDINSTDMSFASRISG